MSREIRRVPKDWEHPIDESGGYQPIFDETYLQCVLGHFDELPWYLKHPCYIKEWFECFPDRAYCRPRFRKGTATHYQIYENVSEGTPISPIFYILADLIEWLIEKGYSREAAENFAKLGSVPSFIFTGGKMYSNIECAAIPKETEQ